MFKKINNLYKQSDYHCRRRIRSVVARKHNTPAIKPIGDSIHHRLYIQHFSAKKTEMKLNDNEIHIQQTNHSCRLRRYA